MLEDYDFVTNGELEKHLEERHFNESAIGSIFSKKAFETPRKLIEFALEKIKNYSGKRTIHKVKMPYDVGLDAVVSLKELPEEIEIEEEEISDGILVNVAYGVKRKPTNKVVIVAGPLDDLPGKHGFRTIYPGEYCPDFTNKEFWSKHAFAMEK